MVYALCLLLQFIISALDAGEHLVGLLLLSDKHAHELDPFGLSQRVELLIAKMRHQRDARFLDGVVATAL